MGCGCSGMHCVLGRLDCDKARRMRLNRKDKKEQNMTMPKKKRREITVNDTLYHFSVSRYSVTVQNTVTDELITESKDYKDSVYPSDIKDLINRKGL